MTTRLFGTDGIRGKAGAYPFNSRTLRNLAVSAATVLHKQHLKPVVIIGRDTRESGEKITSELRKGFLSAGIDVWDAGVIPTPGISFLVRKYPVLAGVVISASHNPYTDNGIKFFSHKGTKLSDSIEENIENILTKGLFNKFIPKRNGKSEIKTELAGDYERFLRNTLPRKKPLRGLKLVIDCANGATYKIAPKLFSSLGAKVIPVNIKPNGKNINKNCGSLYPERLSDKIINSKADCGMAFDGDGDRVIFLDETGAVRDGDYLLGIISSNLKEKAKLKNNTLVTTVMANLGLLKSMQRRGIKLIRAKVGDRYVYEEMIKSGSIIGGEQSGHIIFREYMQTGDGMLSAMQILRVIKGKNSPLSQLSQSITKYPQILLNTKVEKKIPLERLPNTKASIKDIENRLKSDGRVLVRYSGTENLLRVMIEGLDITAISDMAHLISDTARKEIQKQ